MVTLRVTGDPYRLELAAARAHRLEQVRRAVEVAGGLGRVAGEDEHFGDPAGSQPVEDRVEMGAVVTNRAERCGSTR